MDASPRRRQDGAPTPGRGDYPAALFFFVAGALLFIVAPGLAATALPQPWILPFLWLSFLGVNPAYILIVSGLAGGNPGAFWWLPLTALAMFVLGIHLAYHDWPPTILVGYAMLIPVAMLLGRLFLKKR